MFKFVVLFLASGFAFVAGAQNTSDISGFTSSHFGYVLNLDQNTEVETHLKCNEEQVLRDMTVSYKVVCEGGKGSEVQMWLGSKKSAYQKMELFRDIGNRIIIQNKLRPGKFACVEDQGFVKEPKSLKPAVSDCVLTINNTDTEYYFSVLFLYPSTPLGQSQWIATIATQPGKTKQEVVKNEVRIMAKQIR